MLLLRDLLISRRSCVNVGSQSRCLAGTVRDAGSWSQFGGQRERSIQPSLLSECSRVGTTVSCFGKAKTPGSPIA